MAKSKALIKCSLPNVGDKQKGESVMDNGCGLPIVSFSQPLLKQDTELDGLLV